MTDTADPRVAVCVTVATGGCGRMTGDYLYLLLSLPDSTLHNLSHFITICCSRFPDLNADLSIRHFSFACVFESQNWTADISCARSTLAVENVLRGMSVLHAADTAEPSQTPQTRQEHWGCLRAREHPYLVYDPTCLLASQGMHIFPLGYFYVFRWII